MKVLITLLGRSGWALFNAAWAMVRTQDYVPERVYILTDGCQMAQAEQLGKMLSALLDEYEEHHQIDIVPLQADMLTDIAAKVREIAEREKKLGNILALDVTSGSRSLVMGSVLQPLERGLFDHIFYLHIESPRNAARPYIMIPLSVQHEHDLLREVR